jgi:hypothetical protein
MNIYTHTHRLLESHFIHEVTHYYYYYYYYYPYYYYYYFTTCAVLIAFRPRAEEGKHALDRSRCAGHHTSDAAVCLLASELPLLSI